MNIFRIGTVVKVVEKSDMYGKEGIVVDYDKKYYDDHLVRFEGDTPFEHVEWFSGNCLV